MNKSLCVSGRTLILTNNGYQSIQNIEGMQVFIWNGAQFSLSVIRKTAENQSLYLVVMDDGSELECTLCHSFYITNPNDPNYFYRKELKDLQIGDEIIKCDYPVISGDTSRDLLDAYHIGLLVVGGDTYDIPMNASINNKIAWLSGFIDGYGKLVFRDNHYEIRIDYIYKDFLYNVKLMCNTIQLNPKMRVVSGSLIQLVRNLNGKITYTLTFDPLETILLLRHLDMPIKQLKLPQTYKRDQISNSVIRIQSINSLNRKEDVYSFEEPLRGMGILNGILTGK